jgi:predicted secreted hydrolase
MNSPLKENWGGWDSFSNVSDEKKAVVLKHLQNRSTNSVLDIATAENEKAATSKRNDLMHSRISENSTNMGLKLC